MPLEKGLRFRVTGCSGDLVEEVRVRGCRGLGQQGVQA